ncbi:MAG: STAS domain-containing protein [Desulfarculus sp.]|nr:STAS domain-containing protein [Pseudomonadota bacterium]MBV1717919.1 STAS domain-containing protein [Desulfarculus sp.]MBU4576948.1 STAS domain-containing protein [Pseudomonadota bacterium]MBU4598093.1 STAS domain-containing protein [Pseudomonadota bacterium]MBV1739869.1 STAS domain-containing protein [Desulfarculus sp.]
MEEGPMLVEEKLIGNVLVVKLKDSCLDASVAAPLKKRLHEHTGNGCTKLVLDLGWVEFMDSSGLTVIISTLKTLKEQGGQLVLSGAGPALTSLFQLTRLDKVFKVYPNTGQAVRALSF